MADDIDIPFGFFGEAAGGEEAGGEAAVGEGAAWEASGEEEAGGEVARGEAACGASAGGEGYGSDTGGGITCGTGESVGGGESTLGDTEGVEDDAVAGAVTRVLLSPLVLLLVAALLSVFRVKSATTTFVHGSMSAVAIVRDGVKGMATSFCRYIGGAPPSRMVRIRSARECDFSPFFVSVVKVDLYCTPYVFPTFPPFSLSFLPPLNPTGIRGFGGHQQRQQHRRQQRPRRELLHGIHDLRSERVWQVQACSRAALSPRKPGGMRRVVFNKHAAILGNVLAEIRLSSGSSVSTWTSGGVLLKIVMAIASVVVAFAYATSFDVATASAVYMAAFSWVIVAVSLRLAAATTTATTVTATAAATAAATHDVGTGASARARYRAGRLLSGRRLASCHRTRRRHGRRRENRGYLQKVSRNSEASRSNGHGFGALRGGAGPENGANGQVCVGVGVWYFACCVEYY